MIAAAKDGSTTIEDVDTRAPTVAYVIVAYRSEGVLSACLDAIDIDRDGRHWPIIVVDNASPDRSADVAYQHRAGPTIISANHNGGFGSGCNLGARETTSDAILFVNPDTRLSPGTSDVLLNELADPAIAAAGPSVVERGAIRAEAAGHEPTLRTIVGHFLLLGRVPGLRRWFPPLQLPAGQHSSMDIDWVGGAVLMVSRALFEEVGGFDESIFMYMEDVDLCRRLRALGYRIRFVPSVTVEHALGGSQGEDQLDRWYGAFDAYLRRTESVTAARLAAAAATIGMLARSAVYFVLPGHRRHARRMWLGARASARRVR
jgi:N-acetylglucosaminyl-diphospho-decaprenol L-rhamnosyltransferase